MEAKRSALSSRAVLTGYAVAVVVALGGYLTTRGAAREVAYAAVTLVPPVAIPLGVHLNRIRRRAVWYVLTATMTLLAVANVVSAFDALAGRPPADRFALMVIYPVAYPGLLIGSAILVAQRVPRDAGRVIDAALVGVCGAAVLWELVLRPDLAPAYQNPLGRTFVVVGSLSLMATLGGLLRVTAMVGRARASLALLFVSLSVTLVGNVIDQLGHGMAQSELWMIAYLSVAASALHPSAAHVTAPTEIGPDTVTRGRLVRLGLALAVIPIVGGVPQLFGQPPDGLLLTVGPLVTVPLVLGRVGQLARQRERAQHALAHQAAHDELTGLANRRTVLERLGQMVERFNAGELDRVTVLFCDLDGFKPVNDRLGHLIGDEVLRAVAARLRDCLRDDDLLGRFGGDEFLVVCEGPGGDEIAARVERSLATPLPTPVGTVALGVSVGIATTTPGTPTTADRLVAAADNAMYFVKRGRPGRDVPAFDEAATR